MLADELAKVEAYRQALLAAMDARAALIRDASVPQHVAVAAQPQCPECGNAFTATNPRRRYCSDRCRVRANSRAARARAAQAEAAADLQQTREILEMNDREGITNLNWGTSNGPA